MNKLNGVGQVMSKEMYSMFKTMIKYDLIGGLLVFVILYSFIKIEVLLVLFLGLIVSLINNLVNGIILEYSLKKQKPLILSLNYFIRISVILIIAIPFIENQNKILAYILGYTSHFGFLFIYWIKKWKEGM